MLVAERAHVSAPLANTARRDRASVIAALAAKRLDRTLTTALPAIDREDELAVGPTTIAAFDGSIGGFPRGQLSEIVGTRSSGRTSVLLRMFAAATARGELVAIVDALDRFDPASAVAAGVDLEHVLWIRGHVRSEPGGCKDTNQKALEQAVKALSLVLQAGNFGLVAFDVADAPAESLRRLPFTTWLRVQRMVEGQQAVCVLIGSEPMARSAAGLTVRMHVAGRPESKAQGPKPIDGRRFDARLFMGLDAEARVIRARARSHEDVAVRIEMRAHSSR